MDNRAGEMQVFARVVEAGGFSEAARSLFMTPSTVSKLVARLEARLNVRLVERSTRRVSLTDEGRLYYERSTAILAALDDAEREVGQGAHGTLRINASVGFGVFGVEPLLPAFWEAYPHIVVDLSLSDDIVDLYLDRTDIAFRIGRLPDTTLTARHIGTARRKIVASPDYLKRRGIPTDMESLAHHNCLGFNFRRAAMVWPSREGGKIIDRIVNGSLVANNGESVRRMAIAGVGLARLGDFHVRDDLRNGRLIEVLADTEHADTEEINALFLGGPHIPLRVRVFIDFMTPRLKAFMEA